MNGVTEILAIVVPVFFVLLLGYFAGRAKKFDSDQIQGINELVLDFALPAALFVGTVTTTHSMLLQFGLFFLAAVGSTLSLYVVSILFARFVFHFNFGSSALLAMSVSYPSAAFYGSAILGFLYGMSSATAIAVIGIIGNLFIVPITLISLECKVTDSPIVRSSRKSLIGNSVKRAVRSPIVWAPMAGIILVLVGITPPSVVLSSLSLIGEGTSGFSLFVAGIIIAAYKITLKPVVLFASALKMVALPAVFVALALSIGVNQQLWYEGFLLTTLPSTVVTAILAIRYKTFQTETSSTIALTSVMMVIVLPIAILLIGA